MEHFHKMVSTYVCVCVCVCVMYDVCVFACVFVVHMCVSVHVNTNIRVLRRKNGVLPHNGEYMCVCVAVHL